jgi:glycerol-3-phosphate acyltransferase PlsX
MKIGFDIMGGDFAPKEAVLGAIQAQSTFNSDDKIVLIGDEEQARHLLESNGADLSAFEFIHTSEVIGFHEHPTRAISQKRDSSIAVGFQRLAAKELDAFVSAGNTGAMLVGAMFSVKPIEGVIRPVITAVIPKPNGKFGLLLDAGANTDCKADVLYQFAILGSLMMKYMLKVDDPRVGLVSVGEEKEKGDLVTVSAHHLMEESNLFHFIGNIEGRDFLSDKADVYVCEGFVGNVVLKALESVYYVMKKRGISDEYFDSMNLILSAHTVLDTKLCEMVRTAFKNLVPPLQ